MASKTQRWPGEVITVCQRRHASAARQRKAPTSESHLLLRVSRAKRALAALTAAKISRKPALPMIDILERSTRSAIIRVHPEVINKPSSVYPRPSFPIRAVRRPWQSHSSSGPLRTPWHLWRMPWKAWRQRQSRQIRHVRGMVGQPLPMHSLSHQLSLQQAGFRQSQWQPGHRELSRKQHWNKRREAAFSEGLAHPGRYIRESIESLRRLNRIMPPATRFSGADDDACSSRTTSIPPIPTATKSSKIANLMKTTNRPSALPLSSLALSRFSSVKSTIMALMRRRLDSCWQREGMMSHSCQRHRHRVSITMQLIQSRMFALPVSTPGPKARSEKKRCLPAWKSDRKVEYRSRTLPGRQFPQEKEPG